MTKEELFSLQIKPVDDVAKRDAKKRWDAISKPLDGLGDFEILLADIMGMLGKKEMAEFKKAVVVMCADNGVVEEGVSQCGQENTYLVTKLLGERKSSASVMAKYIGADQIIVDVGVNSNDTPAGVRNCKVARGTKNFLKEPAMSEEECLCAIQTGMDLVKEIKETGFSLLATGEMGIGNTTTATALFCGLTGLDPEIVTGRGAGLSDQGLLRKKKAIFRALKMYQLSETDGSREYAFRALCCVGGLDLAALTGLYIGGGVYGMPIVIDGLISAVAALVADSILEGCRSYMIPSHSGKEKGVELALKELGLSSLLNGNMALGEGTGALMMIHVLDMVLAYWNQASSFDDGNIEQYTRDLNK